MTSRESLHRMIDELFNRIEGAERPEPRPLVDVRNKAGLRQQDVAAQMNVSQGSVSNLEQGLARMDQRQKHLYINACGAQVPLAALWPDGTLWLIADDHTPPGTRPTAHQAVASDNSIVITLTRGNIDHNHIPLASNLKSHPNFFPSDAVGPPNEKDGLGALLTLNFVGLPAAVRSDIAGKHKIFRRRSPVGEFFAYHNLHEGDTVIIERLSAYEYRIRPSRARG